MSVTGASIEMARAFKSVEESWKETRLVWTDDVALHFEERYWNRLDEHVGKLIQAMDRIAPVLQQAMKESS